MNKEDILPTHFVSKLTESFQKGLGFDIANSTAYLQDDNICIRLLCCETDTPLDLISDMWNDLDGTTKIITVAFLTNDFCVNLTSGEIGKPTETDIDKAFVMSQIQISLSTVIQNIYLTMLIGGHRTRIDVDVWV